LHFHAASGIAEWRGASAIPLGVADVPSQEPPRMQLAPGDFVVLLTDGFYECADEDGRLFGPHRVADIVACHQHMGARGVLDVLVREIEHFAGDAIQADDLTAVLIHRTDENHPT
jgi:phosphoserine phosphatase